MFCHIASTGKETDFVAPTAAFSTRASKTEATFFELQWTYTEHRFSIDGACTETFDTYPEAEKAYASLS